MCKRLKLAECELQSRHATPRYTTPRHATPRQLDGGLLVYEFNSCCRRFTGLPPAGLDPYYE
jgi:hypothetical protein